MTTFKEENRRFVLSKKPFKSIPLEFIYFNTNV